jgi:hypothetical protein
LIRFLKKVLDPNRETGHTLERFLRPGLRIGSLLVLYIVLEYVLMHASSLPSSRYEQPVIFLAFLQHVFSGWRFLALVLLLGVIVVFRNRLWCTWSAFAYGDALRVLVTTAALLLTWSTVTYDYNLFYDQAHYVDRILLILCLVLMVQRPVFVCVFLPVLLPLIWQCAAPLQGFSWAPSLLPIRILILFAASFILNILTRKHTAADVVFLVLCLFASHYWPSGWGKIQLDWLSEDHIYFLLSATYANGWLGSLSPEGMASFATILAPFNTPMKAVTLLLECGALVWLWHRSLARFFLAGWILLHLGIFTISGIFFWQWIVLDGVLVVLLMRRTALASAPVFTRKHFTLSVVLIGGSAYGFQPVNLAWSDSRVSYTHRFEAQGVDGRWYVLPPRFFAPYDYQFTLSRFSFLDHAPRLDIAWGATSPETARRLQATVTPEQVFALEAERGTDHYNEMLKTELDAFLQRFIQLWNTRRSKHTIFSWIQAPPLLWTFPKGTYITDQVSIKKIRVTQVTSLFDGDRYLEIRTVPVYVLGG